MAAYLPQPDGSDTCCDCPSRTSPCDDCSGVCPDPLASTITVTVSGVTDCPGITGDLNGTFVLTRDGFGIWDGPGGNFNFDPDPLPEDVPTLLTVQCNDGGFSIDYRDFLGGSIRFFITGIISVPSSLCADNTLTCADGATGGTCCII